MERRSKLILDSAFVRQWSDTYLLNQERYPTKRQLEEQLFGEVHRRIWRAGFLEKPDLLAIGRWKAQRNLGRLDKNDASQVKVVTAAAFRQDMEERATSLTTLHGVLIPVASAILAVWNPDRYTVFDQYARRCLEEAGLLKSLPRETSVARLGYGTYLGICRTLASRLVGSWEVSPLRALDRAMWAWVDAAK